MCLLSATASHGQRGQWPPGSSWRSQRAEEEEKQIKKPISKFKPMAMIGLPNIDGTSCFVLSLLLVVFGTTSASEPLQTACCSGFNAAGRKCWWSHLSQLCRDSTSTPSSQEAQLIALLDALDGYGIHRKTLGDPMELLDTLQKHMLCPVAIGRLGYGAVSLMVKHKCNTCDHESCVTDTEYPITVDARANSAALAVNGEFVAEGDVVLNCKECQSQSAARETKRELVPPPCGTPPRRLIVNLVRTIREGEGGETIVNSNKTKVPFTLNAKVIILNLCLVKK
jgi:hypothetical protein